MTKRKGCTDLAHALQEIAAGLDARRQGQFFEGSVLIPRIQGSALALPPAVILLALVVGVSLGGFFGVLIALPATAALRAVTDYLYRRAAYQPLSAPPGAGSATPAPPAMEPRTGAPRLEEPAS